MLLNFLFNIYNKLKYIKYILKINSLIYIYILIDFFKLHIYKKFIINKNIHQEYIDARKNEKQTEKYLYEQALKKNDNNVVTRHLQKTCFDLYNFDNSKNKIRKNIKLINNLKRKCYGCNILTTTFHHDYVFSCVECGNKFEKFRYHLTEQKNKIAVVVGARTKLGHQIVLKLLKAGSIVIGTSRYPDKLYNIYEIYDKKLTNNFVPYPYKLDLDTINIEESINNLYNYIKNKYGKLDILINSAAQTIRMREKNKENDITNEEIEKNKYGDLKYLKNEHINSWKMTINDIKQNEMEEIFRTNVIGPTLMIQILLPLMKNSEYNPFIINVHAREGLITVNKSKYHIHTNYGKTCLHMLTKCLNVCNLKTKNGKKFKIHGCCPGFISIDEYYEDDRPWIVPPIDEIDGASRILYPLFMNLCSRPNTRRHYDKFIY